MSTSNVIKRIVRKSASAQPPVYADDPVSIARDRRDDLVFEIIKSMPVHVQIEMARLYSEASARAARY